MLGTDELFTYLDKYDLELDPQFDGLLGRHSKKVSLDVVQSGINTRGILLVVEMALVPCE